MPDVLGHLPELERQEAVTAIVNFLSTTGQLGHAQPKRDAVQRGERLYHEVGCLQCHAPRDGRSVAIGTSVPLGDAGKKYTLGSLTAFLKNPQHVRPSGRMPGWKLDDNQLADIAGYLIGEVQLVIRDPNLTVSIYQGSWLTLPNFDELTPTHTLPTAGLDLAVAGQNDNFGLRFDGFLPIQEAGEYTFFLGSDDGSRLLIDGKEVVKVDGVHPHLESSGKVQLTAGVHPVRVEYFEAGGEESLSLEFSGPRTSRQDVAARLTLTAEGNPPPKQREAGGNDDADTWNFTFDANEVERGRELFVSLGCAGCHELKQGDERLKSERKLPNLAECRSGQGCLGDAVAAKAPQYDLSPLQRMAIDAALAAADKPAELTSADRVHHTMQAFNCYACHVRGGHGGATRDRDPFFVSTIPEMGDEGRLPPPLDGVGDKLEDAYFRELLNNGANDRPYMKTTMPKFGGDNVGHLTQLFAELDRKDEAQLAEIDEPLHRIEGTGRMLVGDKGLACIKCHTFGPHKATGIQAIDLQTMHRRLREDWFLRYLYDPNALRPGTRMPTGFPEGVATVKDVYGGNADQQIAAIWTYLKLGNKAAVPDGLVTGMIELKPDDKPAIYRNFIEGMSPRGIAVGYPEQCNLGWDANRMSLSLIWHGRFIDAAKHWNGRGQGNQPPLGDHLLRVESVVAVAPLAAVDAPWPTANPREAGYAFKGYRLDTLGRPTFRYTGPGFAVEDFPEPVLRDDRSFGSFRRQITVTATGAEQPLYFRAAVGREIVDQGGGRYLVDGALRVIVTGGGTATLRDSVGQRELIVPVQSGETLTQTLEW
ncbi:MAG: c-type cytochrome [Planctomycetaceae bacterium]